MRVLLLLLLAAPLAVHAQAGDSAFAPDTIVQMPDGPRVVLLHADPGGVAALRLSVPIIESPAEVGAGRMLAALAERRMARPARRIGARVSASRTPWGLAYSVEGAEADLDYLTYLLRLATAEPRPERGVVDAVRTEIMADLERQAESPGDRLLSELRRAAAPELTPLAGSPASLRLLDEARLRAVWRRSHQSASMSLVAMTSASPAALLAMLEAVGLPGGEVATPRETPGAQETSTGPPPMRSWYGEARADHAVADPHATVAAHLISQSVAHVGPDVEIGVRLWQLRDRTLIVIGGAARSRRARTALRAAVQSAIADVLASLDARTIEAAVERVGLEYRTLARTPGGLVERVGRMADSTGCPSGALRYLAALAGVTASSLADYLNGLGTPLVAEFEP
jgi:hypothetical protein